MKYFESFRSGRFPSLCNTQKVDLDPLQDQDYTTLKHIIQDHFHYTQSTVAKTLLENWSEAVQYFIKVWKYMRYYLICKLGGLVAQFVAADDIHV